MATRSNFHGDFIANGERPARPGRFGTPGLSGVSDFATHLHAKPQWRMALKKLLMTAAFAACVSPVLAASQTSGSSCKYSRYYGYSHCTTKWTEIADPVRDPEQERRDADALRKEDAKWTAFCRPTFKADEYGVRRASYASKGCEFGRSE